MARVWLPLLAGLQMARSRRRCRGPWLGTTRKNPRADQRLQCSILGWSAAVGLVLSQLPQAGLAQTANPDRSTEEGSNLLVRPGLDPGTPAPIEAPPASLDLNLNRQPDRPLTPALPSPAPIDNGIPISNYLLGVGDTLSISVIGYSEFTSQQPILPDGTINLPLIGPLYIQGQTLEELKQTLQTALRVYLVNPVVSLSLSSQRPLLVTVTGEVNRPGPLQLNTGGLPLSQALIQAGGVRRSANISRITIRRPLPQGQEQLQVVNLWQTIQAEVTGQRLLLRDGDVIFVPRLTAEEGLDQRLIARSSLAPTEVRVRFLGEVVSQGELAVPPHFSLSEALALAGGPAPGARTSRVTLLRRQDDGTVEEREISLTDYRNAEQVQDGDIIIVSKRFVPNLVDWTQRITNAINAPVSLYQLINGLIGGSN
ncbi:MAG: polysaccharide biosynthesis/export family protein [Prochlorothrix sp.]